MKSYTLYYILYLVFNFFQQHETCHPLQSTPTKTVVLSDTKLETKKQNNLKTHLEIELPEGSGLDYSDFETEIVNLMDEETLGLKVDRPKQSAAKTLIKSLETQRSKALNTEEKPNSKSCNSKSSFVKITTTYPWNVNELVYYQEAQRKQMLLLDKFSGNLLEKANVTKSICFISSEATSTNRNGNYGEIYEIQSTEIPCARIEAFLEKAVMWSQHIEKAYLNCQCQKVIEVTKVQ